MLTNPLVLYLGREIVDGREQSFATIRGHLYCNAVLDHCGMVRLVFLTCMFLQCRLPIQRLLIHDARMRVSSCDGMLFQLLQHVHELVRGIIIQDLDERTRFDSVLSSLAIWRSEDLNWGAEGCL